MNDNGHAQVHPDAQVDPKVIQMAALVAQVVAIYEREVGEKLFTVEYTQRAGAKGQLVQTTIPQLLQNFTEAMSDLTDAVHELTDAVNDNTAASEPDADDDDDDRPVRRKRK